MIAASVFVLITQNPHQYLVVLFISIFREGQETIIDPQSLMRTRHHQWLILWFTSWLLLLKSGHLSSFKEWQRKRVECLFESNGNPINRWFSKKGQHEWVLGFGEIRNDQQGKGTLNQRSLRRVVVDNLFISLTSSSVTHSSFFPSPDTHPWRLKKCWA